MDFLGPHGDLGSGSEGCHARLKDKEARRDFWKRVIDPKNVSTGWILFAVLIFPAVFAASFAIDILLGGAAPSLRTFSDIGADPLLIVQLVVIGMLFGALPEELGWRGVALERLQSRWNPLLASLVLALRG